MPSCSKSKNPHGVEITFTESDHKYTSVINGETIEYISGTKFVEQFFPKFDPTGEITRSCARKRGLTVEALKEEWRRNGAESCIYGTRTHEVCEDVLLGRKLRNTPRNLKEQLVFPVAKKVAEKLKEKCDILDVEKIVFDEDLRLAGTIDVLLRSKKNGNIIIGDWKTNKDLNKENRYNSFALDPISHVPNTNYAHYNAQLRLYEYILKRAGYIKEDEKVLRCVFHLTEKGSKTMVFPDFTKEINLMMDKFENGGLNI